MQNLKIVYQQKIHKLPSSVVSYQDINEAVKKIYPNLSQFYLFTFIPCKKFIQFFKEYEEIEEINCEFSFSFLKKIYKKEGWTTIKFLVLEDKNLNNLNPESLYMLNQSSLSINSSRIDQNQVTQLNQNRIKIQETQIIIKETQQKVEYAKDDSLKEIVNDILDQRLRQHGLIKKKIIITEQTLPDNYFGQQSQFYNIFNQEAKYEKNTQYF